MQLYAIDCRCNCFHAIKHFIYGKTGSYYRREDLRNYGSTKELERVITELQQLSREKELILNSAGEGIFGLDLDGNITFCNPAGASMLGYDIKNELEENHPVWFQRN